MSSFAEYSRYFRPRDPAESWEFREDWEYLYHKKLVYFNVELFSIFVVLPGDGYDLSTLWLPKTRFVGMDQRPEQRKLLVNHSVYRYLSACSVNQPSILKSHGSESTK